MSQHNFLALDLGAESGRAILGQLDGERLRIYSIYLELEDKVASLCGRLPVE